MRETQKQALTGDNALPTRRTNGEWHVWCHGHHFHSAAATLGRNP